ncbi:TonB-dependent receptor [Brucella sp. NBRC 12950]|uniref:TonB-dependent siderophore receptor n=1 Tax=Brucella sp. NBRC 12950 TaxID=2994518 RepID=UPI0024A58B64|nr:TonB-dependent receptor [Brucella sp. NBRC 12950]GLU27992.1 ligand-gated channel [Brucella sp. NBRC 12950]
MARGISNKRFGSFSKALMATLLVSTAFSGGIMTAHSQAVAQTQAQTSFAVPAGSLSRALTTFGRQAGVQVTYLASSVSGKASRGFSGAATREQALSKILDGSGLIYSFPNSRTVAISVPASDTGNVAADGSVLLGTITVQGQGATTEGSGSYTTNQATVGKGTQDIRRIPQAVSVVTRKQMDDRNVASIEDALKDAPGITLVDSPMGSKFVYSRGSIVDTMQYDGVARSTFYAQANSFSEDMAAFDRVEVLRGAPGLLQGAGYPGATVNMVRKRPLDKKQFSITQDIGSYQNYRTELDATGPLNETGSLRGRFAGSFNNREYFTDLAKSQNIFLYGILEGDISEDTTVAIGGSYKRRTSTPCFHGLPHYSDGSDIGLSRDTCLGQRWNTWDTDQVSVFGDIDHQINDNWQWKTSVDYWREQHDVKYEFSEGAINPTTLTGSKMYASIFDMETSNVAFDSYLDGKVDLFGRTHEVLFGVSANRLVSNNDFSIAALGIAQDVFNPIAIPEVDNDYIIANRFRGGNTRTKIEQQALYGMTRLSVTDPLTVILGGRVSWYKSTSEDRDTGLQSTAPYKENGIFTPYAGVVYDLNNTWSVYASYTDIFQPQNYIDASGQVLDPILGYNYEVGVKGSVLDGRVNTSVSLFRGETRNRAIFDDNNYPCGTSPDGECYIAGGKVLSEGIEIEASGEVLPNFQLAASYTYTHKKLLEGSEDNMFRPTYSPDHLVKVWGDYSFTDQLEGLSLGGGVRFQSQTSRTVGTVEVVQDPYAIFSARIGYQFNEHLQAALTVDNLFDKKYYQTIGAPAWGSVYGDPRTFTLSLKSKF